MPNNNFNNFGMQQAPIINQTERETNFQGYGHSHFSFVQNQGFHATTQIPGMQGTGLDNGLSIHDPVKPMFNNKP